MKKIGFVLFALLLTSAAKAQNAVDNLFIDMRGAFHQEFNGESEYKSKFIGEHFNLNILGHISPNVTYRIRQRFNKKVFDEKNMFNATDFLCINWHPTPKWIFTAGKYAVLIGGYEYDAVPIDVYFYSLFCRNLYQGYSFGALASYEAAKGQKITFQICNSPLSKGANNLYAYNLAWTGRIFSWWHTIWSLNSLQDEFTRMIGYAAFGNHCVFGPVAIDIDFIDRDSPNQNDYFSDYSLNSKFVWSIGKWNICAKVGYECNDSSNFDSEGRPYDLVILPGTNYFYAGCGLEYFPLGNKNLRLHAVYFRDNLIHRSNFDIGVTWRLNIIDK